MRVLLAAFMAVAQNALADPFRSILVHFTNRSDSALTRKGGSLDNGCWSNGEPPVHIAIDQSVDIASESCGVGTGTEFHIDYTLDLNKATMSMHYDNPAIGSNSYEETTPQGYSFARTGGSGDNAELTVVFGCDSTTCDGIPDDWKKNGVTIDPGNGNPPQFVDLPSMGVSLDRPNVLVQLDWMQDSGHNQQLVQAAIDAVISAFDKAPVTYRGATRSGITLIVDAGPNSTLTPGGATWGALSRAKQLAWTQDFLTGSRPSYVFTNLYSLLKSNLVPAGRLPIFHYAVAAAEMVAGDSTSGVTTPDALAFTTTLFDWTGTTGNQNEQTGTFMHELGHVLGLQHSGTDGNADAVNWKPNYPSIMNYMYQTRGVFRGGTQVFDYSRDTTSNLDETLLTEAGGVNLGANPSAYGTGHKCANSNVFVQAALAPVDWNCDNNTPNGTTGFDGNGDGVQNTLNGSTSDWSRLLFKTGGVGAGAGAKDTVTIPSSGVATDAAELTVEQDRLIRVLPLNVVITYTGSTSADYHDPFKASATLVDPGAQNAPIGGRTITFQLGSGATDICTAVTDVSGMASCVITPSQMSGPSQIVASFAGDTIYKPGSAPGQPFTIKQEETTISYIGPTAILQGAAGVTLRARLVEDGTLDSDGDGGNLPPSPLGRSVKLTLGTQSCTGLTDGNGIASCTVTVSGALGSQPLKAEFLGDAYYAASSDTSKSAIVFAFPSRGAFVVGGAAAVGGSGQAYWWGDSWAPLNTLAGGAAPSSFKGFAGTIGALPTQSPAPDCGTTFVTLPGNSTLPTDTVPSYMGVLVASSVSKNGVAISGNWGQIVVVKTDPGYASAPGHVGTGTIVAQFCQ